MRNLLALILLVVFTLQATVVVVEEHLAAGGKGGYALAMADDFSTLQEQTDTTGHDVQLPLNDIEELSDYMAMELLIPVGSVRASLISPPETIFLPADLQGPTPPPRA